MAHIIATPEVFGAMTGNFTDSALAEFGSNPMGFLQKLGIDPEVEVKAVKNSSDIMNLALPFYSDIPRTLGEVDEDALEATSGGMGWAEYNIGVPQTGRSVKIAQKVSTPVEPTVPMREVCCRGPMAPTGVSVTSEADTGSQGYEK